MHPDSFCPLPWTTFYLEENGHRRLCCASDIIDKSFFDNSNRIDDIKSKILNNIKVPECSHCWRLESNGIQSYRQDMLNDSGGLSFEEAERILSQHNEIPPKLYDLRIGSICNLACRTCGPYNSTGWYSDWISLTGNNSFYNHIGDKICIKSSNGKLSADENLVWYKDINSWDKILLLIKKSIDFYGFCIFVFQGGEPLMRRELFDFFNYLIDKGVSKYVILRYTTNLTTISNKIFSLWDNFKKIEINGSVDGVGKINDYIRYPSKFSVIEKNINRLKEYGSKPTILTTVSTYSVLYLDLLTKWADSNNLVVVTNFAWNPNSSIFSPLCVNKNLIIESSKRLNKLDLSPRMQDLVNMFNDHNSTIDKTHEFLSFTKKLDKIRNQNIYKTLPELFNILRR